MSIRESYKQGTPSWVDLMTTDPAGAQEFYGALFGWEYDVNPVPDEAGGGEYIMVTKNGHSAAGMGQQNPEQVEQGIPPMWTTYITVDDIEAATGKVEGAGGSVMAPVMEVMEAGHMSVVVDPTGAVLCLWQANQHIGCEIVNEPGALIWNELITDNMEAAAPFYKAVLDMDTQDQDMGGGQTYTCFMASGDMVGGMLPPPMDGIPNHWTVYFAVADMDDAVATVNEKGGTVMGEPFHVPGVGRMAAIADPQGATLMIMQPEGETN